MKDSKHVFISTSIPYVNAAPHIGHAQEFVIADILARYCRLTGAGVFFVTGTDDNALKNVQAAEKEGVPVQDFVDQHAAEFRELATCLNLSADYFIRTSNDLAHRKGTEKLWRAADAAGDLYKKSYEGLYCIGCEEFKTEKDLVNGECPEHPGKILEKITEENYFFRLSRYSDRLLDLIVTGGLRVTPTTRAQETLSFIQRGLDDFSVSRSVERARSWGIPVPGDSSQMQYVWFDALSNYINALGYADDAERYQEFWVNADRMIHVIGKGINRFHTIYWPAMLMSAGVRIPTDVLIHGYLTTDGQKMSKSIGNVIDPMDIIDEYGADALRYYIARHVHPFEDSDFTMEKFKEAYNADLANGLGNLVARIMQLAQTHLSEPVELLHIGFPKEFTEALQKFELNRACDFVWQKIQEVDQKITATEPFKVVKTDREKGRALITELVIDLAGIAVMLEPIIQDSAHTIWEAIKQNKKPENLFPRPMLTNC